ncbi:MAG TPA: CRTAC1 family protein [Bryobacteraceae bacterium]|nr:CRTAC1 family protein [Bryobacteraceae bacterium]
MMLGLALLLAARFTEVGLQAGITHKHENGASPEKFVMETFGSGVAAFDFDGDGWVDLFFVNGADLARGKPSSGHRLYRNTGGMKFVDVTDRAGLKGNGGFGTGVAVGDFDGDGRPDLYVTGFGANQLFRNEGGGVFRDVTARAGVAGGGWSSSAGFVDYDRDGHLDLFVVRYLSYDIKDNPTCGFDKPGYRMYCDPRMFDGKSSLLFRNNGDGTFTDVSKAAGIANPAGKGLGLAVGDIDNDGWPDLYVANDGVRNFLYHNQHNGTFVDIAYGAGVGFDGHGRPQAGMGTEIADYDNDGRPDIFVTNFADELNTLYRNLGGLQFEDATEPAGLSSGLQPLGFGTRLFDFDNDGDLDIHVTNGHVIDNIKLYNPRQSYAQTDLLYENLGGKFKDISASAGPAFGLEHVGRGSAVADFDNDGDLDIVISNVGARPYLFRNDSAPRGHWLSLDLGTPGARVVLTAGGKRQFRYATSVNSYLSSSDPRLHFGLGEHEVADRIEIFWPDGSKQLLENVKGDRVLKVHASTDRSRSSVRTKP